MVGTFCKKQSFLDVHQGVVLGLVSQVKLPSIRETSRINADIRCETCVTRAGLNINFRVINFPTHVMHSFTPGCLRMPCDRSEEV